MGPLEIDGGDDVAGQHAVTGDGDVDHFLDAAGDAERDIRGVGGGNVELGGEASAELVEIDLGDGDGELGLLGKEGRGEGAEFDVGVGRGADGGEGGADRGADVVAG